MTGSDDSLPASLYAHDLPPYPLHAPGASEVAAPLAPGDQRLRALAQITGNIYWITDAQGRHLDLTTWCAFTGQTLEEASGSGWLAAVHPDDREHTSAALLSAARQQQPYHLEHRVRRYDGQYRVLLTRGIPTRDANGAISEWVGTSTDLTETRQQSEQLRATLEVLPAGVAIADAQGTFLQINPAFKRIWGEQAPLPEDVDHYRQYRGWWPDGTPLSPDQWGIPRALQQGAPSTIEEIEIESFTGERKRILNSAAPIRDAQGAITGAVAAIQDITLQKLTRQGAEARAQELEAIFAAMKDGIIIYDQQGLPAQMNPAMRAILGVDALPEYRDKPVLERKALLAPRDPQGAPLPDEDWPAVRLLRGEAVTGTNATEMRIRALDGQERDLSVTGAPIFSDSGEIVSAVLVSRDVTERRQLERQTQAALEALLRMAELLVRPAQSGEAPESAVQLGQRLCELSLQILGCQRGSISLVEPGTQQIQFLASFGYSPEEEQLLHALLHDLSLSAALSDPADLSRLLAGETISVDLTQPPYEEWGPRVRVQQSLVAPILLGEQLVGVLGFGSRQSVQRYTSQQIALAGATARLIGLALQRERLQQERAEAQARAQFMQATNQMLDTFLGVASHELRTPLALVLGNLQLAERRVRTFDPALPADEQARGREELEDLLNRAEVQGKRMRRLVADLLDVVRIKDGKLVLRQKSTDLTTIVRDTIAEQRQLAPGRSIFFQSPQQPALIYADAERIGQVITNYLSNALKYSPNTAPVEVTLQHLGTQARLEVRDHGPGIPEKEQERIWDRFQRATDAGEKNDPGAGLGLGLFICRTIIERHGGRVGLLSQPGQGATFWFTLPLTSGAQHP